MRRRKLFNALVLAMLLVATFWLPAAGAPTGAGEQADIMGKIESLVLEELAVQGETDFFVWLTEVADLSPADALRTKEEKGRFVFEALRDTAARTQQDLRRVLDGQRVDYQAFYITNKVLVRGGSQAVLLDIAARPDVGRITANHQYQLQEPFPQPMPPNQIAGTEANISFIKADDVWALGYDGSGTIMAGNDTGLDETHPTIARHYRGCLNPPTCTTWDHNYNWWDATGTYPTNPYDGHGHGTHTTGTMVGDDGGANQIGVAPGAQTVHCKNMTDSGSGSDATFTECFQWDLAPWDLTGSNPNPSRAPDAVNNSWGYSGGNQNQFRDEIQALHAAGILVEVSAGNEGPSCATLRSPGDYWEVLTTGSVGHLTAFPGTITSFSSRGPSDLDTSPPYYFPDIMAPGEGIRSALPGGSYASWSGTSMAGPHATALVGLMWSACPSLVGDVVQTIDIIRDTAVPLAGQGGSNCGGDYTTGPNNDWGFGTIDSLAAVQEAVAQCAGTGTLAGTVTVAGTGNPVEGATVTAVWLENSGQWSDTTDAAGYYGMTVPIGQYNVTAEAFAYQAQTQYGVEVLLDQVTTQDFSLALSPQFQVWGFVTEAGTGQPLYAEVQVLDAPLPSTWTDPATGYYSMMVPEGTYTFQALAALHQPEDRVVLVNQDQQQDYALQTLPCVLLVDDDNEAPDVRPYFSAALDSLGYDYDVFDVGTGGGNGPSEVELQGYSMVIWFTGDKYGNSAGPNSTDEASLAAYLDGGGRLFLSSQDYLYDFGLTAFGQNYLGIGSYTNDTGNALTEYGVAGDPIGGGLGPYSLAYPSGFTDYGDIVHAGSGASVAFTSALGGGNNLDVDKDGGSWKTVFFGTSWVPVYYASAAGGEELLDRIVNWFGGCGPVDLPPTVSITDPVEGGVVGDVYRIWATASDDSAVIAVELSIDGEAYVPMTEYLDGTYYYDWDTTTYSEGGHTLQARATDNADQSTESSVVNVTVDNNEPPIAAFDYSTTDLTADFTDTSTDSDGTVVAWSWTFGDGGTSLEQDPSHTYATAGTYTVSLTVTDDDGATDSTSHDVTVTEPNVPPNADFTFDTTDLTADFTDTSTDSDGMVVEWSWAFGDGNTSYAQNPSHTYENAGTYSVSLTVTDDDGATDSTSHDVTVTEPHSYVDYTATGEIPVAGTVSGSYEDTQANDGVVETIQERESGGKPDRRHTYLEHKWTFSVPAGGVSTIFYANAWAPVSDDGDQFQFYYSTDDSTYTLMFTVTDLDDNDSHEAFDLTGKSGNIYIQVVDTDRSPGHRTKDTVYVDHLYIRTDSTPPEPPAAPSGLLASAFSSSQIDLSWTDNADNELGFYIERSLDGLGFSQVGSVGIDVTTYSDTGLTPGETYFYRVQSYNSLYQSDYSNTASATTPPASYMTVGALTGDSEPVHNKWNATVQILVTETGGGSAVANATVTGLWSDGATGTAECTTNDSGWCSVTKRNIKSDVPSVTFTVTDITHAFYTYEPGAITSIIVFKPT